MNLKNTLGVVAALLTVSTSSCGKSPDEIQSVCEQCTDLSSRVNGVASVSGDHSDPKVIERAVRLYKNALFANCLEEEGLRGKDCLNY